jgi:hypothetical protein
MIMTSWIPFLEIKGESAEDEGVLVLESLWIVQRLNRRRPVDKMPLELEEHISRDVEAG